MWWLRSLDLCQARICKLTSLEDLEACGSLSLVSPFTSRHVDAACINAYSSTGRPRHVVSYHHASRVGRMRRIYTVWNRDQRVVLDCGKNPPAPPGLPRLVVVTPHGSCSPSIITRYPGSSTSADARSEGSSKPDSTMKSKLFIYCILLIWQYIYGRERGREIKTPSLI